MPLSQPPHRLIAIVCVAALGITAGSAGVAVQFAGAGKPVVYAEFNDASPIIEGNDVKMSGVQVGVVESIEVRDGKALLGLRLEDAALPLHSDATATIRPVSLLGERYVALDRGSPTEPELDGDLIPVSQTGQATDLDEVLSAIDEPTGEGLAALVTTLGEGVRGQGKEVDQALAALEPAMRQTDQVARILREHNALLTSLVDRVEPVAASLAADDGRRLDRLVDSTELLLRAAADNRAALEDSLVRLPTTLAKAQRTLSRLSGVSEATTPTLASLRPLTSDLSEVSAELRRFAASADPALASLQPVLRHADRLLEEAAPTVRALGPAARDLRGVAREVRPLAMKLTDNLDNVLDFVRFWALTTNGSDGLSNYFRAHLVVSPETVGGPVPGGGDVLETPELDLTKPPKLPDLGPLPTLPELGTPEADNVTGLTADQEEALINQLLGAE